MKFKRAITFSFENPKWWFLSLIFLLANNVPVFGPIVLLGYFSDILGSFVRTKNDSYEDFDFKKVTDYFKRGLYPLLVQLIISFTLFIIYILLLVVIGGTIFCFLYGNQDDEVIALIAIGGALIFFIIAIIFSILVQMIMIPSIIAAALTRRMNYSFSSSFLKGFIKLTWKELLLVQLFYFAFSLILLPFIVIPGAILLLYVIIGPIALMTWHFKWQLYMIYLKKGGKALPIVGDKMSGH